MGSYTELIFGAQLKENTPNDVIETVKWLLSPNQTSTPLFPESWKQTRISWMFKSGGSYYFGAQSGNSYFTFDEISKSWRLSARFNIKNYDGEIEKFLEWIKPWIEQGSGNREFYAIVTTEDGEPKFYHLNE